MGLFSRKRSTADDDAAVDDEVEGDEADDAADLDDDDDVDDDEAVEAEDLDDDDDEDEPTDDEGPALVVLAKSAGTSDDDEGDDDDLLDTGQIDTGQIDTGQIEFELADWGARERQMLDSELAGARVRRAWEASTLVVRASDADIVDDLIDLIEERIALDLRPDVEPVIYEVGDWPAGLEERLIEVLIEARIAHRRGYREVTVGIDDEDRVDALVEQVTAAWEDEQPTEDEIDGPDAQDVLSELFVSADRLMHDASDRAATVRFDDAAASALSMAVPFGFDDGGWGDITDRTGVLRDRLGDAEATDDEIIEAATELRTHLRPIV